MSRAPKRIPLLPRRWLFVNPRCCIDVFAGGQDVDDLVVRHVSHRGGEAGLLLFALPHERGLVEPDGTGLVEPFAVGLEQGFSVGKHGVVDRVPVAGQFGRHL
jgi:hypothetical protein